MALIQCPMCGHTISDKAVRCPKCGEPVSTQMYPTPSYNAGAYPVEKMNSGNNGKKTAIIVVSIVAAILAIAVVFLLVRNNRSDYLYDDYETATEIEQEPVVEPVASQTESGISSSSTLESAIQAANEGLPQTIDEGIVMEKIRLEGDYVVYYYVMDEDYYSIDLIRSSKNEMKTEMKDELLNSTDSSVKLFLSICRSNHKGIASRYVGSESRESYTIYITPSEL